MIYQSVLCFFAALFFAICMSWEIVHAQGAQLIASAPTALAVQAKIDEAKSGDIVIIPEGTATWTQPVNVSGKAISIKGQGIGKTILTHHISTKDPLFSVSTSGGFVVQLSDMTLMESADGFAQNGIVRISSTSYVPWRVHHIHFNNLKRRGVVANGFEGGLIDHCVFHNETDGVAQGVTVFGNKRESWERAPSWGTERAVYIENNLFDFGGPNDAGIEGYRGARFVARHNEFRNCVIGAHGFDSDPMVNGSTYSWEIYKNTFTIEDYTKKTGYHQMRGGSGVLWGNSYWATWEGGGKYTFYGKAMTLDAYRASGNQIYSGGLGGRELDGRYAFDGNEPVTFGAGVHTGSSNVQVLVDSTKSWTTNQWLPAHPASTWVRPHHIWNRTDGSSGPIESNTATSLQVKLSGGLENDWDKGDEYVITYGYPSLDQIGRSGPTVFHKTHSTQVSSPCYAWNNRHNEGLATEKEVKMVVGHVYAENLVTPNAAHFIKEGREFFNGTCKPGYVPYIYPHPLAQSVPGAQIPAIPETGCSTSPPATLTPNAPGNLRVQ